MTVAGQVVIDTDPGPVETVVRLEGDRVREVTLKWTPAFVVQPAQLVKVPEVGEVPLESRWGPATSSPSWRRPRSAWRCGLHHRHQRVLLRSGRSAARGILAVKVLSAAYWLPRSLWWVRTTRGL